MGLEVVGYRCAIRYVVVAGNRRTALSREPLTCQDPYRTECTRESSRLFCQAVELGPPGDAGFHAHRDLKHHVTAGPPASGIFAIENRCAVEVGRRRSLRRKTGHSGRGGGRQARSWRRQVTLVSTTVAVI